jgi:hypothetical protein
MREDGINIESVTILVYDQQAEVTGLKERISLKTGIPFDVLHMSVRR